MPREQIPTLYRIIGERLRKAREARGLTQQQVVRKVQKPLVRSSLANIEAGSQRVSIELLYDLAGIYGRSVAELLPAGDGRTIADDGIVGAPRGAVDRRALAAALAELGEE